MERFLEYTSNHPFLVAAVVLALVIVIVNEKLMNQGALVLDIRKPEEFALGHVNGARQLPSDQILTAGDSFKRYKEKPVVVIDDSGSLAAAAVRQLGTQGFTKAFLLRGGFKTWRADNLPVTRD
jgi:rhodanese-related sulfurtransferase